MKTGYQRLLEGRVVFGCIRLILVLFMLTGLLETNSTNASAEPLRIGWKEQVELLPGRTRVRAISAPSFSGSTLYVLTLSEFERAKERWVKFGFHDLKGAEVEIERKLERLARGSGSTTELTVPVVNLGVCLGGRYLEGSFKIKSVSRRGTALYLGRDLLQGNMVIDPSASFTVQPDCKEVADLP